MLNNRKRLLVTFSAVITFIIICTAWLVGLDFVAADTAGELVELATVTDSTTKADNVIVLNDSSISYPEYDYKAFYDVKLCQNYALKLSESVTALDAAILSNEYTEEAVAQMIVEKNRLQDIIILVNEDAARYSLWEQEHYYAAKTWEFLMQHGYSEAVASGIIGNMMVETSGCTLDLKPTVYSPGGTYYGLCQWSKTRKPKSIDGSDASFEEQLSYLHSDIPVQFDAFGSAFGTSHTKFLAIQEPESAALVFAKVYERCSSSSYSARQRSAKIAYNYFTNS